MYLIWVMWRLALEYQGLGLLIMMDLLNDNNNNDDNDST